MVVGITSPPEIIRLAAMMYVRFPLSLRQVEDLLHERGVDISHETVRAWWNRFGVRGGDQKTSNSRPVLFAQAVASGRGFRSD